MNSNVLQINFNNKLIDLSAPIVMGVLNTTPDSFFKGNRFVSDKEILKCVEKIIAEGGSIIDIGGYSTRPQADVVSDDEEIRRVSDALEIILKKFPDIHISVDTFRSTVVREVVKNYKVAMINDIGGGTLDSLMFETIADLKVAYVLMHTRGTPQTMQNKTKYDDLVGDVFRFLEKRVAQLRLFGVNDIIIDPGFGFAKTGDQNFELLKKLSYFKELNVPILAGLSRKSMIYKLLDTDAEGALNGTTAANMLALMGGASILRVHDVKEAFQAVEIYKAYCK
ncbi:MAG TPA: dihydropteroate synthase [Paludibacter sp.]|nr:dihydropteroate synthase [Paludibacter sp.]